MTGFGPQLIGQTEKALGAMLGEVLAGTRLDQRQWVALRLTAQTDGTRAAADVVRAEAHLADADDLIDQLAALGLVAEGRVTEAGRRLIVTVTGRVDQLMGPVWQAVDPADLAAAERALRIVRDGARAALGQIPQR